MAVQPNSNQRLVAHPNSYSNLSPSISHRIESHSNFHRHRLAKAYATLQKSREDPIQSYTAHHHHHDDDDDRDGGEEGDGRTDGPRSDDSFADQTLTHESDQLDESSAGGYSPELEDGLLRLRIDESRKQVLLRHGFNEAYNSEQYLEALAKSYFMYWDDTPYKSTRPSDIKQLPFWRPPVKHRTVCAALFICLRLGFDPPDVFKTSPGPKLEAWVDPKMHPKEDVLDTIAKKLQEQFESLAPPHARVKFKTYPDVYSEEFKKTLIGLRKYSKADRCLVYYNGHGVPRPTQTGELWVFNKAYTQYIPISVADILSWVGPPAIFIWDCNNAGHIVNAIISSAAKKDEEIASELGLQASGTSKDWPDPHLASGSTTPSATKHTIPPAFLQNPSLRYSDTIQLGACQADQILPLDPDAPADIFTACLSSPIEMALRFYVLRNNAKGAEWTSTWDFFRDLSKLDKVPGRMEMRRTPLGELTWIFTSIADAIAWNHLDRQLFTRIFRGDLVLAATFRGFLLAERVMRSYGCTPISIPKLPPTHRSELWNCWDLEVDMCLSQLPAIWKSEGIRAEYDNGKTPRGPNSLPPRVIPYKSSTFFSEQLTAFELWLKEIVAHNPEQNGDRDEEFVGRQNNMLRWSCNDWPSVKMDKIDITDFASAHPPKKPQKSSQVHPTTGSVSPAPEHDGPRPICYRLPTYIKYFPLNSRPGDGLYPPSPPQLPIVLQVLLSQLHRLRALILLCRFMDLGPWAVHLSLSIGIFQYVLKLLQAPAAELRPVLIFIWARILTVYPEGRIELFRPGPGGGRPHAPPDAAPVEYFVRLLAPHHPELLPVANVVDHKAMCAFILSIGCKNLSAHAVRLVQHGVLEIIAHRLSEMVATQRQWYIILLAHLWEQCGFAKGRAIKMGMHTLLSEMLGDGVPEVRTAVVYAFGTLLGVSTAVRPVEVEDEMPFETDIINVSRPISFQTNKLHSLSSANPGVTRINYDDHVSIEVGSAMACCHFSNDGSPMFRHELVVLLSAFVDQHLGHFIVASYEVNKMNEEERVMNTADSIRKYRNEEDGRKLAEGEGVEDLDESTGGGSKQALSDRATKLAKLVSQLEVDERDTDGSMKPYLRMEYRSIYIVLLDLTLDPIEEVSKAAKVVVDYLHSRLASSVLGMRLGLDEVVERDDEDDELVDPGWDGEERADDESQRRSVGNGGGMFNVNQLVPKFVKVSTSGWRTPFGRSPEAVSEGFREVQPVGTATRAEGKDLPQSSRPSPNAAEPTRWEERRQRLAAPEEPIELVIDRTRGSDHQRRQRQRNYPITNLKPNQYVTFEEHEDYLIYLGLHDLDELRDQGGKVLPLQSNYYDLSCHVFLKPRMASSTNDSMMGTTAGGSGSGVSEKVAVGGTGGLGQSKAVWRKLRNEQIIIESQPLKADAARVPWDRMINEWKTEATVNEVVMHQFEDQILTSDVDGYLTVYDTETKLRLNRFKNSDDRSWRGGGRVTSLKLVNEDDVALALTGTADGTLRIFRNYDRSNRQELVTAFKALPNMEPSTIGQAGLITDWQQSSGMVIVGGDSREIKVWSSTQEACIENIPTRAGSCLTSLSSDHVSGFIICAGFGDGAIRIYDRREALKSSMVRVYKALHRSWVGTLHMQRGGQRELVSGDTCGDVGQWDIRLDAPLRFFRAHEDGMPALALHEHAPVFGTGSVDGTVKLWDISSELFGVPLKPFYSTTTNTGHKAGRRAVQPRTVTTLGFHPHRMMLSVGRADGRLEVMRCREVMRVEKEEDESRESDMNSVIEAEFLF